MTVTNRRWGEEASVQGGHAEVDEATLIEQARTDPEAFGELYRRNVDRIYTYIFYRVGAVADAEDLTARTFYQALSHLPNYRNVGLPFIAWLYRIAHNLVANHHRARGHWKMASLDDLELPTQLADNPERAALASERRRALWAAIRRQPEDRQRLLILKFAERLSNEEIGQLLDRTESSVKSLYFRTLRALKADLEARGWQG